MMTAQTTTATNQITRDHIVRAIKEIETGAEDKLLQELMPRINITLLIVRKLTDSDVEFFKVALIALLCQFQSNCHLFVLSGLVLDKVCRLAYGNSEPLKTIRRGLLGRANLDHT